MWWENGTGWFRSIQAARIFLCAKQWAHLLSIVPKNTLNGSLWTTTLIPCVSSVQFLSLLIRTNLGLSSSLSLHDFRTNNFLIQYSFQPFCKHILRLCLTQLDRRRHSVSDVVEYVTTEKVTRIYFQHTSCIHTPVGNSNTLGLYRLITSYFEAFFLKERMKISDSLHKLRISHRMSFSHYKQDTCVSQI
jgi:hypothetical protein